MHDQYPLAAAGSAGHATGHVAQISVRDSLQSQRFCVPEQRCVKLLQVASLNQLASTHSTGRAAEVPVCSAEGASQGTSRHRAAQDGCRLRCCMT